VALFGLLVVLLWLLSVAGHFRLIFFAYKESKMWALAVFFLSPIAAIVFARKHWEVSKNPFLVYMTSFSLAIVLSVFMAYSSMGVELSKLTNQADLAKNMASLQNFVQLQQPSKNPGNADNPSTHMSQHPISEDGQKFRRLMSEYADYEDRGLTDRSRRYLIRNARELLLLKGLRPEQRTKLAELMAELEGWKSELVAAGAVPSQVGSEQVLALNPDEGPDTIPPKIFMPPTPFITETPEVFSETRKNLRRSAISDNPKSAHEKSEHLPWDLETIGDRSPIKKISFQEAKQYIGSQISFLNLSGVKQKCFLVDVSRAGIACEKRFQSGTFSTLYSRSEVKSLKVYRN